MKNSDISVLNLWFTDPWRSLRNFHMAYEVKIIFIKVLNIITLLLYVDMCILVQKQWWVSLLLSCHKSRQWHKSVLIGIIF